MRTTQVQSQPNKAAHPHTVIPFAGGYSYRLCKVEAGKEVTEACFQQTPLNFATPETEIRYQDGSQKPFNVTSLTTDVGTYPVGSQWRKNPVPMCNCDVGLDCGSKSQPDLFTPYKSTHFRPGQTNKLCPTGVQFPTLWDGGAGAGLADGSRFGTFAFTMVDRLQVPNVPAGHYSLSWRW
jgi:hypothetical protein